jgi:hypothetical protein
MKDNEMREYFDKHKGKGILATADGDGQVDVAVYAKPHFMDDGTLAFIMRDRLTHSNSQANPHAAYMYIEDGPHYKGKRLFLTKVREEKDSELLFSLRRKDYGETAEDRGPLFLVFYKVDKVLPLVGPGESVSE